jgi:hypothetical protein
MGAWEEHQETEARLQALDAKAKKAQRDFERLNRETPDEEKDEQGWTPGLLAAARRWSDADREWSECELRETERAQRNIREALARHSDD